MTKKEFNKLTADLPDDSELYFYLNCIYLGTQIHEEIGIKDLGYEYSPNGATTIYLYDE